MVPDIAAAYQSRMKVADLSSYEEVKIFNEIKHQIADAGMVFKNDLSVIELAMNVPTLDDTMPDNERFIRALKKQTQIKDITVPFAVVRKLPDVLRENDFTIKVVIKTCNDTICVMDIMATSDEAILYGLAVDIGTTTVSAILMNMKDGHILAKASSGNGQIRYGADVINRIIESTKEGGVKNCKTRSFKKH